MSNLPNDTTYQSISSQERVNKKAVVIFALVVIAIGAFAWWGFRVWVPLVLGEGLSGLQDFSTSFLYGYALFAGVLVFAAPCAIGILPAYLSFYLGLKEESEERLAKKIKKGLHFGSIAGIAAVLTYLPILAILYFVPSLVLNAQIGFTTTASYLALSAWTKPVIIAILIIFGLFLVTNFSFNTNRIYLFVKRKLGIQGNASIKQSVFGFGLLYGVGSWGCGMLVLVPLVIINLLNGVIAKSLISFLIFLAGFYLAILVITTLVSLSKGRGLQKFIAYAPWFKRGAGVIIILAAAWLINFYIRTGGM